MVDNPSAVHERILLSKPEYHTTAPRLVLRAGGDLCLWSVTHVARPYLAMRWRPAMPDPAGCLWLSRELSISQVTAQVLYNRGLTTPDAVREFLTAGRSQILDPFLLKDMDRAVDLLRRRIASGRPIMVYGDYDVDGVTGTTILVLALRALGAEVEYYIPDRFAEGYGLNVGALTEIRGRGHDFVLSVDTGVSAVQEALAAKELGITLVVSDHHEPGPELPGVPALINPKRPDCTYPFKGLSGVGVAFKLALALGAPNAWELLDIVTLGTIADMVPLVGENRAIVREGLATLGATRRPGLKALMEVAGVKQPVTATDIGFKLGPRINALGRMGSAMTGVELLTTEDSGRATELAHHLDAENRSRQEVEAGILAEALQQAQEQSEEERSHVLVLAGEGWHHGVVGICASRVLEAYHRPAILLSIDEHEVRGSARSIPAFHLHRALLQVSDLFTKFGGHAAAAGMTLKRREDVPVLRRRLNEIARQWLRPEDLVPELRIDSFVGLDAMDEKLLAELQTLQPHGIGNPGPIFAVQDVLAADVRTMGKEQQHLKLVLSSVQAKGPMEAVGWSMAPAMPPAGARLQVAAFPEFDTYQGRNRLRLTMKDLQVVSGRGGNPVNLVDTPSLTAADCVAWDPLQGAQRGGAAPTFIDARGARLGEALAAMADPHAEVAATAEGEEHETPEPSRKLYLEALLAPAGSRVLVLTASPWAAVAVAAELQRALPDLRREIHLWRPGADEPQGGVAVVAPYGALPRTTFTDTVLYHPPYHRGQVPGGRVHLLWEESDWRLAEVCLGWPYPDRDVLVQLYKLLRSGEATARRLAGALQEMPGPWNELRLAAGMTIFREVGILDQRGQLTAQSGARFELGASQRYRNGQEARRLLADSQASNWPLKGYAI